MTLRILMARSGASVTADLLVIGVSVVRRCAATSVPVAHSAPPQVPLADCVDCTAGAAVRFHPFFSILPRQAVKSWSFKWVSPAIHASTSNWVRYSSAFLLMVVTLP